MRYDPAITSTLETSCVKCKQVVTLIYLPSGIQKTGVWLCPREGCRAVHTIGLAGTIVRVLARNEPVRSNAPAPIIGRRAAPP